MPRGVSQALARGRRAQPSALVAGRPRHLAWVAAVALAFAVPFGMSAVRGDDIAPAAAAVAEPPAVADAPAVPALHRVKPLPAPPRVARRSSPPRVTAPPQPAATTPAPVAPVAPAPAPAAPAPPPQSFDLTG